MWIGKPHWQKPILFQRQKKVLFLIPAYAGSRKYSYSWSYDYKIALDTVLQIPECSTVTQMSLIRRKIIKTRGFFSCGGDPYE